MANTTSSTTPRFRVVSYTVKHWDHNVDNYGVEDTATGRIYNLADDRTTFSLEVHKEFANDLNAGEDHIARYTSVWSRTHHVEPVEKA